MSKVAIASHGAFDQLAVIKMHLDGPPVPGYVSEPDSARLGQVLQGDLIRLTISGKHNLFSTDRYNLADEHAFGGPQPNPYNSKDLYMYCNIVQQRVKDLWEALPRQTGIEPYQLRIDFGSGIGPVSLEKVVPHKWFTCFPDGRFEVILYAGPNVLSGLKADVKLSTSPVTVTVQTGMTANIPTTPDPKSLAGVWAYWGKKLIENNPLKDVLQTESRHFEITAELLSMPGPTS